MCVFAENALANVPELLGRKVAKKRQRDGNFPTPRSRIAGQPFVALQSLNGGRGLAAFWTSPKSISPQTFVYKRLRALKPEIDQIRIRVSH